MRWSLISDRDPRSEIKATLATDLLHERHRFAAAMVCRNSLAADLSWNVAQTEEDRPAANDRLWCTSDSRRGPGRRLERRRTRVRPARRFRWGARSRARRPGTRLSSVRVSPLTSRDWSRLELRP